MLRAATFVLFALAVAAAQDPPDAKPADATKGTPIPSAFRSYIVRDKRYPVPPDLMEASEAKRDEVRQKKPNLPKVVVDPADPPAKLTPDEIVKKLRDVRDRTNRSHCLVCEYGLNPTVVVFAPRIPTEITDPLVKLLQDLDQAAAVRKGYSFGATVAFLVLPDELQFNPQRDQLVSEAVSIANKAQLSVMPVGLSAKKSPATAAWKLDGDNAEAVTVVFYDKLRVIERWPFPDGKPSDADRKTILDTIQKEFPVKKN